MDDDSPTKNDTKDAKVIAQVIRDGRYHESTLLEDVYAELREGMKLYDMDSRGYVLDQSSNVQCA